MLNQSSKEDAFLSSIGNFESLDFFFFCTMLNCFTRTLHIHL